MGLELLTSPIIVTIFGLCLVTIIIMVILDTRRSKQNRGVVAHMMNYVTENYSPTISVLSHVTVESVGRVRELSEQLLTQKYDSLELVLFIDPEMTTKHTASVRRVQRELRGTLPTRVIRRTSNLEKLITRYASGTLVCELPIGETLSQNFMRRIALESIDPAVDAIQTRKVVTQNDTLMNACSAIHEVAIELVRRVFNMQVKQPMIIRKSSYGARRLNTHYIDNAYAMVGRTTTNGVVEASVLISILLVAAGYYFTFGYGWQLITLIYIGLLVLLLLTRLITLPYTLATKLSLILMIPFWPLLNSMLVLKKGIGSAVITIVQLNNSRT